MVSETDEMVRLPVMGSLTYREWHAFVDGLYCGYVDERTSEYTQEKHYWRTGFLVGSVVLRKAR
ncbi:hypothetical protein HCTV5_139 [Halovirus HCTV-5]|uniref:hypothetical protein n=1 Tax=Halovirus HCTV-5 TaxID=1273748 RepID=UPI00033486E1|nr:hypothetical protein M200_gp089 [Halovirus HCTV-5]AGM11745.1 hypothetical protein HCTV5_139 [Halovirus HCTV-5]